MDKRTLKSAINFTENLQFIYGWKYLRTDEFLFFQNHENIKIGLIWADFFAIKIL